MIDHAAKMIDHAAKVPDHAAKVPAPLRPDPRPVHAVPAHAVPVNTAPVHAVPVNTLPLEPVPPGGRLVDRFGRVHTSLRLSVTDRWQFALLLLHAGGKCPVPAAFRTAHLRRN